MPLIVSEVLADTLNVSVVADGVPLAISELSYSAKVNSARIVYFTVDTKEYAEACRLGAKVVIQAGREASISNLSFIGLIKEVQPTEYGAQITAMDYIALLASSTYVNYEDNDILGRDLYFLAADAMDIEEIDTSFLTQGSGIRATADMKLQGLQTRKEFIDKCFRHMYEFVEDATSYRDKLNVVYYQYFISINNRMEIRKIDDTNIHSGAVLSVSNRNNLVESIKARLDTSTMVNSATVVSSTNEDIVFTYTDADSISKYGPVSELITLNTEDYPVIVNEALLYVNRYKKPSYNFIIVIRNADHLGLGDLVEVEIPTLERKIKLPIASYSIDTANGIVSTITLGRVPLSLSQMISKIR